MQPNISTIRTSSGDVGLQNCCWNICCTLSIVWGMSFNATATWPNVRIAFRAFRVDLAAPVSARYSVLETEARKACTQFEFS